MRNSLTSRALAQMQRNINHACLVLIAAALAFGFSGVANAQATFGSQALYASGQAGLNPDPENIITGDFDNDGDDDLAVADFGADRLTIRWNNGSGVFTTSELLTTPDGPVSLAAGDLDNDGDLDIISVNRLANSISVFRRQGTSWLTRVDYATGSAPVAVGLGRFNADSWNDVAVTYTGGAGASLEIRFNTGTGTGALAAGTHFNAGSFPVDIAVADFNDDGHSDIAVPNNLMTAQNVSVLLCNTSGGFPTRVTLSSGFVTSPPGCIVAADFSGDGRPDLLVGSYQGTDNVHYFQNNGSGVFPSTPTANLDAIGGRMGGVAAMDVESDGDMDALALFAGTNSTVLVGFSVFRNNGSGTFLAAQNFSTVSPVNADDEGSGLAIGNFDNDCDLDVAISMSNATATGPTSREIAVFMNTTTQIHCGDVEIRLNNGNDVAYIGQTNTLEIWIRNSRALTSMSMGYDFTIGRAYSFNASYGNKGYVDEEGNAVGRFDLGGLQVSPVMSGGQLDKVLIGGAAIVNPLPVHSGLTLCYTMQFTINAGQQALAGGFCIDNVFIPPSGTWQFTHSLGTFEPSFQGIPGVAAPAACFDIVQAPQAPPLVTNCPSTLNVEHCASLSYQFQATGTAPLTWSLVSGGGSINSSTGVYTRPPSGIGAYPVSVRVTNALGSNDCNFNVLSTNTIPAFVNPGSCGGTLLASPGTPVSFSFAATDVNACDQLSYSVTTQPATAGPVSVSNAGMYEFTPANDDAGRTFTVTVSVADGVGGTANCQFTQFVGNEFALTMRPVGDEGNADHSSGVGGVAYRYMIGQFEITNAQYVEFLNAVGDQLAPDFLFHQEMEDHPQGHINQAGTSGNFSYSWDLGEENTPANFVSWNDAARYCNWLHNGKPTGDPMANNVTQNGSYSMSSATPNRNANAIFVLPTHDEWVKAGHYDPNSPGDHYWTYQTRSDAIPTLASVAGNGNVDNPGVNVANYLSSRTNIVGDCGVLSNSHYGTADQGGNVFEWLENLVGSSRAVRGGSYAGNSGPLSIMFSTSNVVDAKRVDYGFRVACPAQSQTYQLTGSSSGVGYSWRLEASGSTFTELFPPIVPSGTNAAGFVAALAATIGAALGNLGAVEIDAADPTIFSIWLCGENDFDLLVGTYGQQPNCFVGTSGCVFNPTIKLLSEDCDCVPGDADGNGLYSIADAIYLINRIFNSGPTPIPYPICSGDANCDGVVSIADGIYLINFIFAGGPSPCDCLTWLGLNGSPLRFGSFESGDAHESEAANKRQAKSSAFLQSRIDESESSDRAEISVSCESGIDIAGVQLEFKFDELRAATPVVLATPRSEKLEMFSVVVDGILRVGLIDLAGKESIAAGSGPILTLLLDQNGLQSFEFERAVVCDRSGVELNVTFSKATENSALPQNYSLEQNYPNPFNPSTTISYALPHSSLVQLDIYNVLGQSVRRLVNGFEPAGYRSVEWDGRDDAGHSVPSGVYFYKITSANFTESRKMLMIK